MKRCGVAVLLLLAVIGCSRREPAPAPGTRPSRSEVWNAIQPHAARYRMDPAFVYALVAAESDFDPAARNGAARGLMQLKPAAWRTVTDAPYEPNVWDWRTNLAAGIDYLAYARSYLHRKDTFSYPHLLAAFHYGIEPLERRRFDLSEIPVPENAIYRELWRGNLSPVPPPADADSKADPPRQ